MFPGVLGAVDFHQVFFIIVLVISILSWLVNLIQGNSPNGSPPRQQGPKAKPQTTRSELENLIQELTSDKRKQEPRREAPPATKPRTERPRPAPTAVPQRPGGPPPYTPSRSTPQVPEPKRQVPNRIASNVGEGIRGHHVGSRIEATGLTSPGPTVSVSANPQNRNAAPVINQEQPVHPLVKFLREPDGVRQAIILNEILQRPKSVRH